jgi:cholesterol transport system auxiliary component
MMMTKHASLQIVSAWLYRFTRSCRVILCMGLLFSLASCSIFAPVKTPPDNRYALSVNTGGAISGRGSSTLLVSTPVASPGYDTTDMIYVSRPFERSHYANNHWISPPADMLGPILQQRIRSSGCFRAVVTTPSSGTTDLILNTQLLALQHEIMGDKNQTRVALNATLIDNATQQILAQRRFESVVPAYQLNPYSGVIAANSAVANVAQKLAVFLCRSG